MVYQSQQNMIGIDYAPELDTQMGLCRLKQDLTCVEGFGQCQIQKVAPKDLPAILEVEYSVPVENFDKAIEVIKNWINTYSPILAANELYVRFTGGDDLPWLSNSKGSNNYYVWFLIDFNLNYAGANTHIINLLEEQIWKIAGGYTHLGKYNNINDLKIIELYKEDGIKFLELANKL